MKSRFLLIGIAIIAIVAAACGTDGPRPVSSTKQSSQTTTRQPGTQGALPHEREDPHGHDHSASRVPAFQTDAAGLNNLPPTLLPEQFFGKAREAYSAARAIPQTIAQLPCYCYCDEGHGHKSLYSCFVDNHASQCAVCVDEALLAYRLEKGQKMGAPKIRELIVAKYSSQQTH